MWPDPWAPAQWAGYAAFVLGVGSFLQTSDRHFKLWMAAECLAYMLHFVWLDHPAAVASSALSLLRSLLALHTRSPWVAMMIVGLNIGVGTHWVQTGVDVLPLLASSIGTLALFLLSGVRMRLCMLAGTACWVIHNLWAGSIGGSALEVIVMLVNIHTILRMRSELKPSSMAAD